MPGSPPTRDASRSSEPEAARHRREHPALSAGGVGVPGLAPNRVESRRPRSPAPAHASPVVPSRRPNVHEAIASPLAAWESFYVIVGSSAAALTGLQFVVIALIAESGRRSTSKEITAFGTPTIVHFCAVLLIA